VWLVREDLRREGRPSSLPALGLHLAVTTGQWPRARLNLGSLSLEGTIKPLLVLIYDTGLLVCWVNISEWQMDHHVSICIYKFIFLGPCPWHMEAPRLRFKSELQLSAYAIATATSDPSRIHSSWQCWILNPLSEARDQTRVLMGTSWVRHH